MGKADQAVHSLDDLSNCQGLRPRVVAIGLNRIARLKIQDLGPEIADVELVSSD